MTWNRPCGKRLYDPIVLCGKGLYDPVFPCDKGLYDPIFLCGRGLYNPVFPSLDIKKYVVCSSFHFYSSDDDFEEIEFGSGSEPEV